MQDDPRGVHANPSSADLYERLGIAPDAGEDGIRAAYKAMRKELHPDSKPESLRQHFDSMMMNVNEAHQVLTDPRARAKYDSRRAAGAQAGGTGYEGPEQEEGPAQEEEPDPEEAWAAWEQAQDEPEGEEEDYEYLDDEDYGEAERRGPPKLARRPGAGGPLVRAVPGSGVLDRTAVYVAAMWAWLTGWTFPAAFLGLLGVPISLFVGFVVPLLGLAGVVGLVAARAGNSLYRVPIIGGEGRGAWWVRVGVESMLAGPAFFGIFFISEWLAYLLTAGALLWGGVRVADLFAQRLP